MYQAVTSNNESKVRLLLLVKTKKVPIGGVYAQIYSERHEINETFSLKMRGLKDSVNVIKLEVEQATDEPEKLFDEQKPFLLKQ